MCHTVQLYSFGTVVRTGLHPVFECGYICGLELSVSFTDWRQNCFWVSAFWCCARKQPCTVVCKFIWFLEWKYICGLLHWTVTPNLQVDCVWKFMADVFVCNTKSLNFCDFVHLNVFFFLFVFLHSHCQTNVSKVWSKTLPIHQGMHISSTFFNW